MPTQPSRADRYILEALEERQLLAVTVGAADEFGSTISSATPYSLSGTTSRTIAGVFNTSTDVDVIGFTASFTGRMRLEMIPGYSTLGHTMLVTDANGAQLVKKTSSGASNVTYVNVMAGQKIYVRLNAASGKTGNYSMKAGMFASLATPTPDASLYERATITAGYKTFADGKYLVIQGTGADDYVSISKTSSTLYVTVNTFNLTFSSAIVGIQILGFGGNDTVKVRNNVTIATTVWGGDGDDKLYLAGQGADIICGGAGNDSIIAIGGWTDRIYGQEGLDTIWADSKDAFADVDATELGMGNVHSVSAFYQPYTTDSRSTSYVSLELAGQKLRDPTPTSTSYKYVNFASKKLFSGIQYNDIAQGAVGDCYYLATLASFAQADTNIIRQMITDLGDGTYAVRFYDNAGKEVYVRVDADLPVYSGSNLAYAKFGPGNELWVPLVEKAYAFFRTGAGTYASISGGWMSTVYRQITGRTGQDVWLNSNTTDQTVMDTIANALASNKAVTVGSTATAGPIVGSHAYMVKNIDILSGIVTVYNPWGYDGRGNDGNSGDGLIAISVSDMKTYFSTISVSA